MQDHDDKNIPQADTNEEYWSKKLQDENYYRQIIRPQGELIYENLVLEGGGVLGAAYAGAIKELEKQGVLANIKRVGGSSAGAIGSLLLAVGNTADDLQKTLLETTFSDFLDPTEETAAWKEAFIEGAKGSTVGKIQAYQKAQKMREKGLFKGEAFVAWEQNQIRQALKKVPGFVENFGQWRGIEAKEEVERELGTITFGELHRFIAEHPECGLRDLYVTASNIDLDKLEIFSHESTPDVPLYIAVRMSMSFPTAFNVVTYDVHNTGWKQRYVDGGLFNNYPMHMFDQYQYVPQGLEGIFRRTRCNLGTLGLKVDTADEIARFWNVKSYRYVDDMTTPATRSDTKISEIRLVDAAPAIDTCQPGVLYVYKDSSQSLQYAVLDPMQQFKTGKLLEGKNKISEKEAAVLLEKMSKGLPSTLKVGDSNLSWGEYYAIKALLKVTRRRSHTPRKKMTEVEAASKQKTIRHMVASFYGKEELASHHTEQAVEERIAMLYPQRTIPIHDTGVASTDFSIDADMAQALVESGKKSVSRFFESHRGEKVPDSFTQKTLDEEIEERTIEELMTMIKNCREMIAEGEEHGYDEKYIRPFRQYIVVLQEKIADKALEELALVSDAVVFRLRGTENADSHIDFLGKEKEEHLKKMQKANFETTGIFSSNLSQFTDERIKMMFEIMDVLNYHTNAIFAAELNMLNIRLDGLIEQYHLANDSRVALPQDKSKLYAEDWVIMGDWEKSPAYQEYREIMQEVRSVQEKIERVSEVREKLQEQLDKIASYQSKKDPVHFSRSKFALFAKDKEAKNEKHRVDDKKSNVTLPKSSSGRG